MSDVQAILQTRDLGFEYRKDNPVLMGVNLDCLSGKLLCILGPNGSGKTTLLRCLLGQLEAKRGSISLDGKSLGRFPRRLLARALAYVPQIPSSAFAFNVFELVMMGRFAHVGMMGLAGAGDRAIANQAMKMTETDQFAGRSLSELSGGEAQRVMIARALAQQPQVMLLDEPTSHLDIKNQLLIYQMMSRLAHEWSMAVICVSHDLNLAGRFADQLVLMRDGRVLADGAPAQVFRKDVLAEAYDIEVDLISTSDCSVPLVRAK